MALCLLCSDLVRLIELLQGVVDSRHANERSSDMDEEPLPAVHRQNQSTSCLEMSRTGNPSHDASSTQQRQISTTEFVDTNTSASPYSGLEEVQAVTDLRASEVTSTIASSSSTVAMSPGMTNRQVDKLQISK